MLAKQQDALQFAKLCCAKSRPCGPCRLGADFTTHRPKTKTSPRCAAYILCSQWVVRPRSTTSYIVPSSTPTWACLVKAIISFFRVVNIVFAKLFSSDLSMNRLRLLDSLNCFSYFARKAIRLLSPFDLLCSSLALDPPTVRAARQPGVASPPPNLNLSLKIYELVVKWLDDVDYLRVVVER